MTMPTRLERTPNGDFLLPDQTTELLSKIEDQMARLVQVMDSETLTVSSLFALVHVLHSKIDRLSTAAEQFVMAAVVQLEQEESPGDSYTIATSLDDRVQDLIGMYDEFAQGLDVEVTDGE